MLGSLAFFAADLAITGTAVAVAKVPKALDALADGAVDLSGRCARAAGEGLVEGASDAVVRKAGEAKDAVAAGIEAKVNEARDAASAGMGGLFDAAAGLFSSKA